MAEREYIEREEIIKRIKLRIDDYSRDCNSFAPKMVCAYEELLNMVVYLPTADVQEVRHGKWETIIDAYGHIEGWLHKECGRQVTSKDEYCPNCGAKMDKE